MQGKIVLLKIAIPCPSSKCGLIFHATPSVVTTHTNRAPAASRGTCSDEKVECLRYFFADAFRYLAYCSCMYLLDSAILAFKAGSFAQKSTYWITSKVVRGCR